MVSVEWGVEAPFSHSPEDCVSLPLSFMCCCGVEGELTLLISWHVIERSVYVQKIKLSVQHLLTVHFSEWLTVDPGLGCYSGNGEDHTVHSPARAGPPCRLSYLPAHRPP